jgi:hypothetical protein
MQATTKTEAEVSRDNIEEARVSRGTKLLIISPLVDTYPLHLLRVKHIRCQQLEETLAPIHL